MPIPANLGRYVEHHLAKSTVSFPIEKYPNIETLAEAALRNLSSTNLSSTTRFGTGAVFLPVETAYHDDFYRALRTFLGNSTNLSSEWSADWNGRTDFRLPDVGWGIDLVREGNRLEERCQSYTAGGRYAHLFKKGLLKDWLIIDCRTSHPKPYGMLTVCWKHVGCR